MTLRFIEWLIFKPLDRHGRAFRQITSPADIRPTPAEPIPPDADPWSHPDTARRFRVLENIEELLTDIPQVGCLLVHVVAALRTYQAFLARFAMVRAFDARSDRAFWS